MVILSRIEKVQPDFFVRLSPGSQEIMTGGLGGGGGYVENHVYTHLSYLSNFQEPNGCRPPSSINRHLGNSIVYGHLNADELAALPRHFSERKLPKNPHTESSLLPPLINSRKVTITG